MTVAPSINSSVILEETLSQTVRLERGSELDGIINGNSETPAVPIMPSMQTEELMNASNGFLNHAATNASIPVSYTHLTLPTILRV